MYDIIRHLHSINRWIVLALLLFAILSAFSKWIGNKDYTSSDRKLAMSAMMVTHLQLVLGLILIFISPKVSFDEGWKDNPIFRYYGLAHLITMVTAIVLITIGYSVGKRRPNAKSKFLITWIFYALGLISMLGGIPWNGKHGAGWY